tara:strand:+ start:1290 stop:1787 length:498 start_codon:yes stop_codon:yes gene_type:complete
LDDFLPFEKILSKSFFLTFIWINTLKKRDRLVNQNVTSPTQLRISVSLTLYCPDGLISAYSVCGLGTPASCKREQSTEYGINQQQYMHYPLISMLFKMVIIKKTKKFLQRAQITRLIGYFSNPIDAVMIERQSNQSDTGILLQDYFYSSRDLNVAPAIQKLQIVN